MPEAISEEGGRAHVETHAAGARILYRPPKSEAGRSIVFFRVTADGAKS